MTRGQPAQGRVLNLPNLVTVLRLLLLGPMCWLLLAPPPGGVGWAIAPMILLVVWAGTDWADGFLARRLHQVSRIGGLLDPLADRIGIAVVIVVLAIRGLLPWWLPVVIVAVDLVMAPLAGPAARRGVLTASKLGKFRTALLLIGLVGLVVGAGMETLQASGHQLVIEFCRGLLLVGMVLHVIAALDYLRRVHRLRQTSGDPDHSVPGR